MKVSAVEDSMMRLVDLRGRVALAADMTAWKSMC